MHGDEWMRGVWVSICAGLLGGCGTWSDKTSTLPFPLSPQTARDDWAGGGALVPMTPGADQSALVNPFDPIALNNMAVAEAARGRYPHALALLQRAVKLAPARADIAANLASIQRWLDQAEGQAAMGLTPQPLQVPYQEPAASPVPPLWLPPQSTPSR